VETSFFSRWFNDQDDIIQNRVHWLVKRGLIHLQIFYVNENKVGIYYFSGQLEFISGGWSMNDEAAAHYSAIIDQLTLGMHWLNQTFGKCGVTRIGWQIDPFGHSREQASIFSQMGFDGMFLGRIDFQDKLMRERTRTLEFIWKSSPSLGKKADLFTGVLPNVYWPPKGFCYDVNCFDEEITANNAHRKAIEFIRIAKAQALQYATNHTIITMGMDFYYRSASRWYTNLDRLMNAINAIQSEYKVNIIYSSPSCYLKSLNEADKTWPVKLDDFFPYADAWNAYWTGLQIDILFHFRIYSHKKLMVY
jgi:lysosomal alpha-mannosidase